jgi:hypothetical protein
MIAFPAKARLENVVRSLLRHLPQELDILWRAERFAEQTRCIRRLMDGDCLRDAVAETADAEAQWLAQVLEARWRRIGEVRLDPAVAVVGPAEVWVGGQVRSVRLDVATLDLAEDWRAEWLGAVVAAEDTRSCTVTVDPIIGSDPVFYDVTVRVTGRCGGRRCIQTAQHRIQARKPVLEISDDRRRIKLSDHTGAPGGGVEIDIGDEHQVTGANGLLEMSIPLGADTAVWIHGLQIN